MTPAARDAVRRAAMPLDGGARDYDRLIERARAVDVVLLGEDVDDTRAVEPLETTATWERGELPDTYPHAV